MIVVAFSGSRRAGDRHVPNVQRWLAQLVDQHGLDRLAVVHGCADGIDTLVDRECQRLGVQVVRCPANWKLRGNSAGPHRNGFMLDYVKVGMVVALPCQHSVGTRGMISMCERRGIPCHVEEIET